MEKILEALMKTLKDVGDQFQTSWTDFNYYSNYAGLDAEKAEQCEQIASKIIELQDSVRKFRIEIDNKYF